MRAILAQRQLSLCAAAVLGVVVALALAARDEPSSRAAPSNLPRPAVSDLSGWYSALAGVRSRPLAGRPSGCGTLLAPKTLGVDHPVLPCGARIFVSYHGKTVLTSVVDRGPYGPGREFELTPALAELLKLSGVQTIRWSFARAE
ncbi:MAG TPA: RlpA-like double-psi beta-barrel domain-containing protein [Gaiellaceae bacterium]|nr:RlpA-like double-psi beta-barrel domain-containing protein [Gaiellaceae bacterium]